MIRIIFCVVFFTTTQLAKSQLTINAQLPPAGLVTRDQLWNIVVANNGNGPLDLMIELSLKEALTGQLVLTGSGPVLSFPRGVKMITALEAQPVQYNILGAGLNGNYLPLGSFIACYRLSRIGMESSELMAEECVPVHIQPLSPPLLQYPSNGQVLEIAYPPFLWSAPTPFSMYSELQYDLLVAEVLEGQSPAEAIAYNSPVYSSAFLTQTHETYPASYLPLDTGKTYAWQVLAKNGYQYSAQTEVWTFRIAGSQQAESMSKARIYTVLRHDNKEGTVKLTERELFVRYYSNRSAYTGRFQILDAAGNIAQELTKELRYGDNFLQFELAVTLQKEKLYQLRLIEPNGRIEKLLFVIQ